MADLSREAPLPSRPPTIRDVAREAGVSKSLVSLVFQKGEHVSAERRNRVLQAAETLGYRPNLVAQSLSAGQRDIVAILMSNLSNPIIAEIVGAIKARLSEAGRRTMILTAQIEDHTGKSMLDEDNLAVLRDLKPAGLITVGTIPEFTEFADLTSIIPTVVASAIDATDDTVATVHTDDAAGISLVVDHLADLGAKRIVFVGGSGGTVSATREQAFHEAMRKRGLSKFEAVERVGLTEEGARQAMERFLGEANQPEGVIAVNDLVAIGAITALEAAGISVPNDCRVTGYDDSALAGIPRISLTTVNPMNRRIGLEAAEVLLTALERRNETPGTSFATRQQILIPPRLVVRDSSR
ncbi:MAG: LacI family DNA-binding transcriptional regulator [Canibacter sp.]